MWRRRPTHDHDQPPSRTRGQAKSKQLQFQPPRTSMSTSNVHSPSTSKSFPLGFILPSFSRRYRPQIVFAVTPQHLQLESVHRTRSPWPKRQVIFAKAIDHRIGVAFKTSHLPYIARTGLGRSSAATFTREYSSERLFIIPIQTNDRSNHRLNLPRRTPAIQQPFCVLHSLQTSDGRNCKPDFVASHCYITGVDRYKLSRSDRAWDSDDDTPFSEVGSRGKDRDDFASVSNMRFGASLLRGVLPVPLCLK